MTNSILMQHRQLSSASLSLGGSAGDIVITPVTSTPEKRRASGVPGSAKLGSYVNVSRLGIQDHAFGIRDHETGLDLTLAIIDAADWSDPKDPLTLCIKAPTAMSFPFTSAPASRIILTPVEPGPYATAGGTFHMHIDVDNHADWTATADAFITISGSGSDSGVVSFTLSENLTGSPREGTVTVTSGDATASWTISQS
jgi:hypothetical protein